MHALLMSDPKAAHAYKQIEAYHKICLIFLQGQGVAQVGWT